MAAVSDALLETIIELQTLQSLQNAYLGGGTNLAIRFNHRISTDIDLFFSGIIGKAGYQAIEAELHQHFCERLANYHYPCDTDDQYVFCRFWIETGNLTIKVEILQNTNFLDEAEDVKGARLATVRDIGLLKLMTASNRASMKDIYDLDYITEDINIKTLLDDLKNKQETFNKEEHKTIFDQDAEASPVDNPMLLLKFEEPTAKRTDRPSHSDNRITIVEGHKNILTAKTSYRRKLRRLFGDLGIDFPGLQPIN